MIRYTPVVGQAIVPTSPLAQRWRRAIRRLRVAAALAELGALLYLAGFAGWVVVSVFAEVREAAQPVAQVNIYGEVAQ